MAEDELNGIVEFQSTHPQGVRRADNSSLPLSSIEFQSTHPQGVRLAGVLLI